MLGERGEEARASRGGAQRFGPLETAHVAAEDRDAVDQSRHALPQPAMHRAGRGVFDKGRVVPQDSLGGWPGERRVEGGVEGGE